MYCSYVCIDLPADNNKSFIQDILTQVFRNSVYSPAIVCNKLYNIKFTERQIIENENLRMHEARKYCIFKTDCNMHKLTSIQKTIQSTLKLGSSATKSQTFIE